MTIDHAERLASADERRLVQFNFLMLHKQLIVGHKPRFHKKVEMEVAHNYSERPFKRLVEPDKTSRVGCNPVVSAQISGQ